MKVLLVSEGPNELGALDINGRPTGPSALLTLCSRLLDGFELEFARRKVSDPEFHIHKQPGKGGGMEKRALGWLRYADREGFDALIFVVDQDNDPDREPQLEAVQASELYEIRRAIGLAVREFDAWMLADEKALTLILKRACPRHHNPEEVTDPKDACDQLLKRSRHRELGLTALYAAVAEIADLAALEQRCVRGFAPFAARVRAMTT